MQHLAVFGIGVLFGSALGWAFGRRERDVALPMPAAAAVAGFVGAFLGPFAIFWLVVVVVMWGMGVGR